MSSRKEEILYKVHDNLYVNLTNKCPCACTFCLRQTMDRIGESDSLWLDHDPSIEEVLAAFQEKNMEEYQEVVFCGFGEPTEAFDVLVQTADYVKKAYGKPVRLNTNGLGSLVNQRDITPELKGRIDTISISLNTPDPAEYYRIVRPRFGENSFYEMLDFAKKASKYVPNVVLSTVDTILTKQEEEECARICRDLGVTYRIRPFEE